MRFVPCVAVLAVAVLAGAGSAVQPGDTRAYWVHEGGWFAQSKDGSWYEMNEQTYRKFGKPSRFKEVRRTKEFVELYDASRKVAVRLFESVSEARLSDREDAAWERLHGVRWKTPTP